MTDSASFLDEIFDSNGVVPGKEDPFRMLSVIEQTTEEEGRFTKYRGDPLRFFAEVLGITTLWEKQIEVIDAACSSEPGPIRVIVRSGHGTGKSFLASAFTIYWVYCEEGRVITTAPKKDQVYDLIWGEIHAMRARALVPLPSVSEGKGFFDVSIAKDTGAKGVTSSKDNEGTGAQGKHHKRLLVIMDEGWGIHDVFWQPLLSQANGERNVLLVFGNPTSVTATATRYDRNPKWKSIHISCLDHPNVVQGKEVIPGAVSRGYVEEVLADCLGNENDPRYRVRVLGEYPAEGGTHNIADAMAVMGAQRDFIDSTIPDDARPVLGVDVGGTEDPTVYALAYGSFVFSIEVVTNQKIQDIFEKIKEYADEYPDLTVNIDASGTGKGVCDLMKDTKIKHNDIHFGGSASTSSAKRHFTNRRAEMFWRLKEGFEGGEISLPECDAVKLLAQDLSNIFWRMNGRDLIEIEPKKAIRARLNRSPDTADAVALALAPTQKKWKAIVVA